MEDLHFFADGHVFAVVGPKDKNGTVHDEMRSFHFSWKIVDDHLQVFDQTGKLFDEFTVVEFGLDDGATMTLVRSPEQSSRFTQRDAYNKLSPDEKRLNAFVPEVRFDNLDIDLVMKFLTEISKKIDPSHRGFKFIAVVPPDLPHDPQKSFVSSPRKFSMGFEEIPLKELLVYVAGDAFKFTLTGNTITFTPTHQKAK